MKYETLFEKDTWRIARIVKHVRPSYEGSIVIRHICGPINNVCWRAQVNTAYTKGEHIFTPTNARRCRQCTEAIPGDVLLLFVCLIDGI